MISRLFFMRDRIIVFFIVYILLLFYKYYSSNSYSLSTDKDNVTKDYVRKYSKIAIREMYISGFPASVKLAQGILESNSGKSELSLKANNHFGIKCRKKERNRFLISTKEWSLTKRKMIMEKECFKKFDSTADCFSYHSNIFKKVKRYQKLFDNSIYDYRSWAIGIKKYGYATDPDYSKKVIGIIEKYKLDKKDIIPIFLFI